MYGTLVESIYGIKSCILIALDNDILGAGAAEGGAEAARGAEAGAAGLGGEEDKSIHLGRTR